MKKVLFVCTGNTCRSCMAEAIFKKLIKEEKLDENISVDSAGIYALEGSIASCGAIDAMSKLNIDLTKHRAKRVNEKIIKDSDVIITMTQEQKIALKNLFKAYTDKIYTLSELCKEVKDIDDPYGGDEKTYIACCTELIKYLSQYIKKCTF